MNLDTDKIKEMRISIGTCVVTDGFDLTRKLSRLVMLTFQVVQESIEK